MNKPFILVTVLAALAAPCLGSVGPSGHPENPPGIRASALSVVRTAFGPMSTTWAAFLAKQPCVQSRFDASRLHRDSEHTLANDNLLAPLSVALAQIEKNLSIIHDDELARLRYADIQEALERAPGLAANAIQGFIDQPVDLKDAAAIQTALERLPQFQEIGQWLPEDHPVRQALEAHRITLRVAESALEMSQPLSPEPSFPDPTELRPARLTGIARMKEQALAKVDIFRGPWQDPLSRIAMDVEHILRIADERGADEAEKVAAVRALLDIAQAQLVKAEDEMEQQLPAMMTLKRAAELADRSDSPGARRLFHNRASDEFTQLPAQILDSLIRMALQKELEEGAARAASLGRSGTHDDTILAEIRALAAQDNPTREQLSAASERVAALAVLPQAGPDAREEAVRAQVLMAEKAVRGLRGEVVKPRSLSAELATPYLAKAGKVAMASPDPVVRRLFISSALDNLILQNSDPRAEVREEFHQKSVELVADAAATAGNDIVKEEALALLTRELAQFPASSAQISAAIDRIRASSPRPLKSIEAPAKSALDLPLLRHRERVWFRVMVGAMASFVVTFRGFLSSDPMNPAIQFWGVATIISFVTAFVSFVYWKISSPGKIPWYREPDGEPPSAE